MVILTTFPPKQELCKEHHVHSTCPNWMCKHSMNTFMNTAYNTHLHISIISWPFSNRTVQWLYGLKAITVESNRVQNFRLLLQCKLDFCSVQWNFLSKSSDDFWNHEDGIDKSFRNNRMQLPLWTTWIAKISKSTFLWLCR
jgi:hypothetical protein